MEDDATQLGVSEEIEEKEDFYANVDRARDEIVNKRDEPEDVEEVVVEDEGPSIEFHDGDKIYKVPASAKYRAKIDGEDTEADLDKMTRSYQKGGAADRRLEEAARRQKELTDYEQTLAQRLQAVNEREEQLKTVPPKGGPSKRDVAARIYNAILEDGENPIDEIAKALGEITPDEDAIMRRAEERASKLMSDRERAMALKAAEAKRADANQWFTDTYSHIVSDEKLLGLAMHMGKERLAKDPNGDFKTIVKGIGDEITEWLDARSPSQERSKPASVPVPRSGVLPKKPEIKEETREDIVADMRRSRGFHT